MVRTVYVQYTYGTYYKLEYIFFLITWFILQCIIIIILMTSSIAPNRHTSIIFCERIKEDWSNFKTYVSARGRINMNQHVNTVLLEDYDNNYTRYMNKTKTNITIDYRNDSLEIMKNKIKYFTDGQIYDDFKALSTSRLFLSNEIKHRGMKI